MRSELDILQIARAMADHAVKRQSIVADNIANADTPGFKARDITPFAKVFNLSTTQIPMRTTRRGHLGAESPRPDFTVSISRNSEASPNGNTVSLEQEMTKAVEVKQNYDMALGIYKKSLDILRLSLGR